MEQETFQVCSEQQLPGDGPKVILAGDSKALQWQPVVAPIALSSGWSLTTLTYSACPLTASGLPLGGQRYDECEAWIPMAVEFILDTHPDLLIVSGGRSVTYEAGSSPAETTTDAMVRGYAMMWQRFVDAGIAVVVILDNPSPDKEMWECAADHPESLSACTFPYPADRDECAPRRRSRGVAAASHRPKPVDLPAPRRLPCRDRQRADLSQGFAPHPHLRRLDAFPMSSGPSGTPPTACSGYRRRRPHRGR